MPRKYLLITSALLVIGIALWIGYLTRPKYVVSEEQVVVAFPPNPTATRVSDGPTATSRVKIPLSIEVMETPVSEETHKIEKYPGFSTIVTLSNDILLPGEINNDGNMIDSLAVFGIGGGDPCAIASPSLFFDEGGVAGCGFSPNERVIIELIRPDHSVVVMRQQGSNLGHCFDNSLLMQSGRYILRVTTDSLPVETYRFSVFSATSPRIFLSRSSSYRFQGCYNTVIEGQPIQIFFEGFQPNEHLIIALYHESGNYELIRTWTAQVDDSGRLVQEIPAPQVKERGNYGIAAFGQSLREVSFSSTEPFYASAATSIIVHRNTSSVKEPLITSATITPRPAVPTLAPSFCPNAPESRVGVGDSIRVTYTDGTPLRLRSSPEIRNDNIIELLPEGTRMKILDGPVCEARPGRNDAFVFWKVRLATSGLKGWIAEGDLYNYYIEKYP